MTTTKFENKPIPKDGFTHKFKQSGKITCTLKGGSVQVKIASKNPNKLSFSQGCAVTVEDDKPGTDTTEWTVKITRDPTDQEATVDLVAPLN